MVVEDNVEMLRFVNRVRGQDCRIVLAANGEEALAKAINQAPDLVVTDLMMPKMGGDRLVAGMRARSPLAQVPVIVLSAKADEELRVKLLSESVQDYVVKLFSAHELRARVHNQVALKRMRNVLQLELKSQSTDVAELSRQLQESRSALERSLEAQRESAQLWRAVFDNSAVGIGLLDLEGQFVQTNPSFQSLPGNAQDELSGISLREIAVEEDREVVTSRIAELRDGTRNGYCDESQYRRRDGSCGWARVSVSVVPGSDLAPRMLVGVFDDTTALRRAEDEPKKLESLVGNGTDFVGIASLEGQPIFVNRAGRRIVGLRADAYLTLPTIDDFAADIQRDSVHKAILPHASPDSHCEAQAVV